MPPGVSAPGLPSDRRRPPPDAIVWKAAKSSPAQNDSPSPDSTTTRTAGSLFSCSPAAASAANIAPSSALRLSGRLRRTSATPWSPIETVTRSLIADHCRLPHSPR